jgi:sugar phosphate isomerase/epimerase
LGLGVDPPAWLAQGRDPVQAVHAAGGDLVSARLADLLRSGGRGPVGCGEGNQLDVLAYRVALGVNGYRRPVVVDTRRWSNVVAGLDQTRRVWEEMG